jgi:DNA-binding MarR family transcriptional regulator
MGASYMRKAEAMLETEVATSAESGAQSPESLSAGLQRLSRWAHVRAWRFWASLRLTPTQLHVLELLRTRADGLSGTALSRELGLSAATVCDCVRALREKGLVSKRRCATDGRQQMLRLTAQGEEVALQAAVPNALFPAFEGLTPTEQECLNALLIKVNHTLEDQEALPRSRTCVRCQFFRPGAALSPATHYCAQANQPLPESALRWDCAVYAAADPQTQAAIWEAFWAAPGRRVELKLAVESRGRRPTESESDCSCSPLASVGNATLSARE